MNLHQNSIKSCSNKTGIKASIPVLGLITACAISGQVFAADAKSAVKVSGILDTGIEHLTNVDAGKDSVTRVPGITGTLPSRLKVTANKEIDEQYKAFATMELGVSPDDGTLRQGGRIFGRQLNFGMQTPAGRFTIGRQYSPFLFATGDLMGPNIYALGSLDAYLPNARMDNSISWSNKLGDNLSAAVAYSFGRDTTGAVPASGTCSGEDTQADESSACRQIAASLKFKGDGFNLAAGLDKQNGGTGATAFFFNGNAPVSMADPDDTDQRITLSGNFNVGDTTIGLGVLKRELDTEANDIESNTVYISAKHKVSPKTTLNGAFYSITNDDHAEDADATLLVVRGMYNVTKGVDVYAQVGMIDNSEYAAYSLSPGASTGPATGESQTGLMVGFRYMY